MWYTDVLKLHNTFMIDFYRLTFVHNCDFQGICST